MSKYKITEPLRFFKGLKPVFYKKIGKYYKYFYGKTINFGQARTMLAQARKKGFHDAFLVGFKDGRRVPVRSILKN